MSLPHFITPDALPPPSSMAVTWQQKGMVTSGAGTTHQRLVAIIIRPPSFSNSWISKPLGGVFSKIEKKWHFQKTKKESTK